MNPIHYAFQKISNGNHFSTYGQDDEVEKKAITPIIIDGFYLNHFQEK